MGELGSRSIKSNMNCNSSTEPIMVAACQELDASARDLLAIKTEGYLKENQSTEHETNLAWAEGPRLWMTCLARLTLLSLSLGPPLFFTSSNAAKNSTF